MGGGYDPEIASHNKHLGAVNEFERKVMEDPNLPPDKRKYYLGLIKEEKKRTLDAKAARRKEMVREAEQRHGREFTASESAKSRAFQAEKVPMNRWHLAVMAATLLEGGQGGLR